MPYLLTLADRGHVSTTTFDGPDTPVEFAKQARDLYLRSNPAPFQRELMIELDKPLFCQSNGQTDLYISRVRFATPPKRDGAKPRWGRWHDLTVEWQVAND